MKVPDSIIVCRANSSSKISSSKIRHCSTSLLPSPPSTKFLKKTHAKLLRSGEIADAFVAGKLVADVADSNLPYAVCLLFHPHFPLSTFAWNSVIRGFAEGPSPSKSISVYRRMLADGFLPNNYTFPFLLKSSAQLGDPRVGLSIHATVIRRGLERLDPFIQTSLISFHAALVSILTAHQVFDESRVKDVTSWNSLIKGYVGCGQHMDAIRVFRAMQDRCRARADEITMLSVVSACTHLGALEMGRWIHAHIDRNRLKMTLNLATALINMYARCGEIESSKSLFHGMQKKDVRTWSVMISGMAIHGLAEDAFDLFTEMQRVGVHPDSVTITGVLSACSHGGMVEEGKLILSEPTIEHYGCVVDLLGRAGRLEEALNLTRKISGKPDVVLWGSLLVACRVHKNIPMGEMVAKEILKLEPGNAGAHVFLSNVYAASGKWDIVQEVRNKMKNLEIHKPPGSSLIEVNGIVHEFLSGDLSHAQMDRIYRMLDEIGRLQSPPKGLEPTTGSISFDINDEDKELCLSQHSEKLAVCFGLISTRPGSPLRIVKNLRICDDCHSVMKLVSEAYGRTVVVRDSNRFHHFRKGSCSCTDYW
ncbi:Putative pentatricopeptide repeat-containing protein [Apostasia shenzhenica]|uniref:Pentatricopeptide repeat-containing protein n=1 Tax=Apostasia shenzhenica TaxID=1088818 RepID=A0A2I0A3J3_9ASPA|nr:Putative pentatricopeptide repeat-containing protein [Apostasia shenzhenica]